MDYKLHKVSKFILMQNSEQESLKASGTVTLCAPHGTKYDTTIVDKARFNATQRYVC